MKYCSDGGGWRRTRAELEEMWRHDVRAWRRAAQAAKDGMFVCSDIMELGASEIQSRARIMAACTHSPILLDVNSPSRSNLTTSRAPACLQVFGSFIAS